MSMDSLQLYLLPLFLFLFFGYRIYKFKTIKNKIPQLISKGAIIIDVRTKNEFSNGANPLSINIPLDQLNSECLKLKKDNAIIVCCASGTRSSMALGILKKNGFKNVLNAGPWPNTIVV